MGALRAICLSWPWTTILSILASRVSRIIGISPVVIHLNVGFSIWELFSEFQCCGVYGVFLLVLPSFCCLVTLSIVNYSIL
jgi:hypothetical protein